MSDEGPRAAVEIDIGTSKAAERTDVTSPIPFVLAHFTEMPKARM